MPVSSVVRSLETDQITTLLKNLKYVPSFCNYWRGIHRFGCVWFVSRFFTSSPLRCLIRCDSRLGLRFHLVIETSGQTMSYTPHSDFQITINNFPHIILEVNSRGNGGDEHRMLLQAACIARIGIWLRVSTTVKPIVIVAIYIEESLRLISTLFVSLTLGPSR
ncbi:hypothetical protein BJV74DRAFT_457961 [Russula compacta]|nr:hypothetical protein BJV74DRAFT_457961 [Russula compacta]